MIEKKITALREEMRLHMDARRYTHTLGVEKEMRRLAEALSPSLLHSAAVAGLLHDVTKCLSYEEQMAYCAENGITVDKDELLAPALLHAKTGAHYAKTHFKALVDDEIASAIASHTTAEPPLSLLGAMLFVADFTEEGRDYPDCIALRELLYQRSLTGEEGMRHFKRVVLSALDLSLSELLNEGRPIALKTVKARNALLANDNLL
ncbi:MAG: HD domain-containing protein [Ruminococcaceae bacterium]|nr:HD domain-containing protein [Oscillospiraceae bacterium]